MIRLLTALLLFPASLSADPIAIRSGEHATFSRLVLSIGIGVDWTVSQVDGGYEIQTNEADARFDTSELFDRIPRTRITEARQSADGALILASSCDCHIDAFLWRPGRLVVDIVDGPDPNEVSFSVSHLSHERAAMPLLDPGKALASETAPGQLPDLLSLRQGDRSGVTIPNNLLSDPNEPDLSETEEALLESIARAASQGLLDTIVTTQPLSATEPIESARVPSSAPIDAPPVQNQPGVGVSTAMDRDLAMVGEMIETQSGFSCLPASLFEIDQWGDKRALHSQIAELSEALAGEFGEQPREAQEDLARVYLHFGFGAEARLVLRADTAMSQSRQILAELGGLIDDYGDDFPLIATQKECETPAALWAFLAYPQPRPDVMRNQIVRDFFGLPQPLRGQLASRLSNGFLMIGDEVAAIQILKASESGDSSDTHDVQATHSRVSEAIGDPQAAITVLVEEANDNARMSPESMIRLIDLALAQGGQPDEVDLVLADAMRQEYRETPYADRLGLALSRGRTALGQFEAALDVLPANEEAATLAAVDHIYARLAQFAEAPVFLEFAFAPIPARLTDETENTIAKRLIELGFPQQAMRFLERSARREAAAERRYLRAEVAVATANYDEAIDVLSGISDTRARILRSQAYAGLGQHREALTAVGPSQTYGDVDLQFRAGAWDRLAGQEAEALAAFANLVINTRSSEEAVTLADRRALLASAEESRHAVEALLSHYDGVHAEE